MLFSFTVGSPSCSVKRLWEGGSEIRAELHSLDDNVENCPPMPTFLHRTLCDSNHYLKKYEDTILDNLHDEELREFYYLNVYVTEEDVARIYRKTIKQGSLLWKKERQVRFCLRID